MRKVLKWALLAAVVTAVAVVYLMKFQGLRVERDGSGMRPIVSVYKPAPEPSPRPAASEAPPDAPVAGPKTEGKPYWTDFRGPRRDGVYDEMPVQTKWPASGPQRLWRRPVGGGYASVVAANGRIFTIEQRGSREAVAAYDLATGREVWVNSWDASFQESMGGDGPRATPTWHDARVYALGAEGEFRCLDDKTGQAVWSKNILRENGASNLQWGMSAAPLIVDNMVIVQPGGAGNRSVAAYDKSSGQMVWTALADKQAYTSPMLVTLGGERQILAVTASRAVGLNTAGKLLWEYPWTTEYDINAAQPVVTGTDSFILSAGYGHGAALVRVSRSADAWKADTIWQNTRMKNKFTSSVLHEGHVYGLDEAILACIDARTGDLKWKGGRYGYGQVVLAGGHVIVATEDGDVALVRATPERHDELVRFSAISGKTWNHPAIANGTLIVRNALEMSAFRIR